MTAACSTRSSPARKAADRAALALFAAFVAYTLVCASARRWWVGELLANWRWQAGWGGLLLCVWLARRRALAVACLALAGFHLAPALRLWLGAPAAASGETLRVASSNVLWRTGDGEVLRGWLERERFDVVALQELDRTRFALLDALAATYPHQLLWPEERALWNEGTWGQALLCRHPFESSAIQHGDWEGQPFLEARFAWRGASVLVLGAHPSRPGRARRIAAREATYAAMALRTRDEPRAVVLGDLNATLYSPAFTDLLDAGRLRDSRPGFGHQGSWLASYSFRGIHLAPGFRLDLDHALVGLAFDVIDRRLGPDIGSDHSPVQAELALR